MIILSLGFVVLIYWISSLLPSGEGVTLVTDEGYFILFYINCKITANKPYPKRLTLFHLTIFIFYVILSNVYFADMAELADVPDLESGPIRVQVRFLLSA